MGILEKLKSGDFNHLSGKRQADGSVILTLAKRGEGKIYQAQVKDLYGANEQVIWEKVIEEEN